MSVTSEYLKRKYDSSCEKQRYHIIWNTVRNLYLKEFPDGYANLACFSQKSQMEKMFQEQYGWERTVNGFEKRTDFEIDETNANEISFITHTISKVDGKYVALGNSKLAKKFILEHLEDFNDLVCVEAEIDSFYHRYIASINLELSKELERRLLLEDDMEYVRYYVRHIHDFANKFGDKGMKMLVRWLNRLTDDEDIDSLITEFLSDVENMAIWLNVYYEDNPFECVKIGPYLAKEIEILSTRGKSFRYNYMKANDHIYSSNKQKKYQRN